MAETFWLWTERRRCGSFTHMKLHNTPNTNDPRRTDRWRECTIVDPILTVRFFSPFPLSLKATIAFLLEKESNYDNNDNPTAWPADEHGIKRARSRVACFRTWSWSWSWSSWSAIYIIWAISKRQEVNIKQSFAFYHQQYSLAVTHDVEVSIKQSFALPPAIQLGCHAWCRS